MAQGQEGERDLDLDGGTVKVLVGPDQRAFHVHENLIRKQSAFFEAAMGSDWKEAHERTITLPDDEAASFAAYVQWLYTRKLYYYRSNFIEQTDFLIDLYLFGQKIIDANFQNKVIDCLVEGSRAVRLLDDAAGNGKKARCHKTRASAINRVYANTPRDSPLRRLFVDWLVAKGRSGWLHDHWEHYNKEYLFDLANEMLGKRQLAASCVGEYEQLDRGETNKYHLEAAQ